MSNHKRALWAGLLLLSGPLAAADGVRQVLEYAPAPLENPLKGLVPYAGSGRVFPHTLEFNYVPFSALVTGYDTYDWKALEDLLDGIASRGHQAIFRVFLEYPGKKDVIPAFLVKDGLKVTKYLYTNTQPFPASQIENPDYSDPHLRKAMRQFIAALGKKYDGDPRVGFITAGLLGTWGEWHTWPRPELFASKEVQAEVMDAYEAAFKITPVLVRYPTGEKHDTRAANAQRKLGYHDDSFAWATLDTGKPSDGWFFMTEMKKSGDAALNKWKTQPIGGEIRPEAWGEVFDANPGTEKIQDFHACVDATHATWLMDSGMFSKEATAERTQRAEQEARRMGYEFHVAAVTVTPAAGKIGVKVELENRGVAPFYYDWPIEFGLLQSGKVAATFAGAGKLTGLLPGDPPRVWSEEFDTSKVAHGDYKLALRVPNTLPEGRPVRFANKTQDADAEGWLTLCEVDCK